MSMKVRRDIKGKYYISKHRRYELEHFVRQYNEWYDEYNLLDGYNPESKCYIRNPGYSDLTEVEYVAERRLALKRKMDMVINVSLLQDNVLGEYIFDAVVNGRSYTEMRQMKNIPCSRDTFYHMIHKFYYDLDKLRG